MARSEVAIRLFLDLSFDPESLLRPLTEHVRPLPDRELDAWPVLHGLSKMSRAISKLLPAYSKRSTSVPSLVHSSTCGGRQ